MKYLLFLFCMTLLFACSQEETAYVAVPVLEVPKGFPDPEFPADNDFTMVRWELGKRLFFDPILSSNQEVSCATCHMPELAFTDGMMLSEGVDGRKGTRNAPSLANVAYHPYFTREGGVPTLEMQVLVPIQEHAEFDFNILLVAESMLLDSSYVSQSKAAYDRPPDAFVITRAISTFERSLLSGNSTYDAYVQGQQNLFNPSELRGKNLFFSDRLSCSECHGGFNFTEYAFENNGLYTNYPDSGRFRFSGDTSDIALFKVPSLRNVSLTAPYMHDGSMATLEDVIEHYSQGGKPHIHKSELIRSLHLSSEEKADLISFLHTLTDQDFITNPNFQP